MNAKSQTLVMDLPYANRKVYELIQEETNGNVKAFAKNINVSQQSLNRIFCIDKRNGKYPSVSNEIKQGIIDAYGKDEIWFISDKGTPILYGEGEMLKGEVQEPVAIKPDFKEESYHLVPLVNIDSVGGLHSQNMITPSEEHIVKLIPFTEAREGDVAIIQSGNSMTPTIPPGSVLLLREVPEWREYFGYGNIFVLWLKDGRRVTKEIRRYDGDAKNYVWCVSHNPDVADEELPKSFIKGVWKVIKFQADFGW